MKNKYDIPVTFSEVYEVSVFAESLEEAKQKAIESVQFNLTGGGRLCIDGEVYVSYYHNEELEETYNKH